MCIKVKCRVATHISYVSSLKKLRCNRLHRACKFSLAYDFMRVIYKNYNDFSSITDIAAKQSQ